MRLHEHVDVGAPSNLMVDGFRPIPVVIAGGDKHGNRMKPLEHDSQKFPCVWRNPIVFIEVATTENGRRRRLHGQPNDLCKRVAQSLPAPPSETRICPCERRFQM